MCVPLPLPWFALMESVIARLVDVFVMLDGLVPIATVYLRHTHLFTLNLL